MSMKISNALHPLVNAF